MYSPQNAKINGSFASKYRLNENQASSMVLLIARTIMKLVPLSDFHAGILTEVRLPDPEAKRLAVDIAIQRFLTLRAYLPETMNLINNLGGQLPSPLPPLAETKAAAVKRADQTAQVVEELTGRDIGAAMMQNEKVGIQIISEKPIKLADSPNLRTPSIGNWLADYAKYKNQFPEQDVAMIRIKYIHDSPNAKALAEQERNILNFVLKSFDEHILLPFSKKTGLLVIEKLIEAQTDQKTSPPKSTPTVPPAPIRPAPPKQAYVAPLQQTQKPSPAYIPPPPVRPALPKQTPAAVPDTRVINLSQQQKSIVPPQSSQQTQQQKPLTEGNIVNLKDPNNR